MAIEKREYTEEEIARNDATPEISVCRYVTCHFQKEKSLGIELKKQGKMSPAKGNGT